MNVETRYHSLITHLNTVNPLVTTTTQVVKDMAKQRKHCESSIARVYSEHVRGTPLVSSLPPISLSTCCIHTKTNDKHYTDTDPVLSRCLSNMLEHEYSGARVNLSLWTIHKRAKIGGIKFTSGNSLRGVRRRNEKMKRCGSVITLVTGEGRRTRRRSLYARVIRFMHFDRLHVAHVEWLPTPDYPTGTPVVVRLVRNNPKPDLPCVVSLTDIDPTHVTILHAQTCMYMIRMNGVDTMS